MPMTFPVRIYINSPEGLVAFGPEHAGVPLPWGLDAEGPALTYGPYFDALTTFLMQNDGQLLRTALSHLLGRSIRMREIRELKVISQKHGAFYHVAQVRAKIVEEYCCLAVNSAVRPDRQAFLEAEFALLRDLNQRFPLGFLPRVFALGESFCRVADDSRVTLQSFLAEWFEDYHEFHLSQQGPQGAPLIKVWDASSENPVLNVEESQSLYYLAAFILTAYYDPASSSQIYPWHHAAGDFVLKRQTPPLQLRLITVRGFLPLVTVGPDPLDQWIPLVHFFLNLSLRLRLDRLDGTGELAWAGTDCLWGVVSGFLESWEQKARKDAALPRTSEVISVLLRFTPEEWLSLAPLVLHDGLEEADELGFIQPRLEEHVISLHRVLRRNA
jgi:hypothetical protein